MFRSPLSIFSIVLLCLAIAGAEEQPSCQLLEGYRVCHKRGTLTEVVDEESSDHYLYIHYFNLTAIGENAFKNLSKTTTLSLGEGNKISAVTRDSFKGLEQLEELHLDNNTIPLSANLFAELKQLASLTLTFNKINKIPKDAFSGFTMLISLHLDYNDLESIDKDAFSTLPTFATRLISLSNNKISNIETGALSHLHQLRWLYLDNNKLTAIGSLTQGLQNLVELSLKNNQLTGISKNDLKGLNELMGLYLEQNQIANIEEGAFADLVQMVHLDLKKNHLTQINGNLFRGMSKLQKLDLSENQITVLKPDAFAGLPALKTLSLAGNKLTSVNRAELGLSDSANLTVVLA
ncbi:unnamed protein product [Xylocopa violacea]|uniref:Uncharacterized protein n=1 Tax=Xylocopa violacea TaxID=135666 RepID=A0ABP1PM60_XYLVO